MATLFLIRHGEPELRGVLLGQLDSPLSETGKRQSETFLSNIQVRITYASPLRRARETAQYLQSEQWIELAELRELDQGQWTGKTWQEIESGWPELAQQKTADWLGVPAPGGESWSVFQQRIRLAWNRICEGPSPAAVVAHLGVNAALANLVDGRDPVSFTQNYGEVISLAYDSANHCQHLS